MPPHPDRQDRLLALLEADGVGYSRLMAADPPGTLAQLDAARAVFRRHIEAEGGRVVDMAGDSVLAAFVTALSAVQAAKAIQAELNGSAPTCPRTGACATASASMSATSSRRATAASMAAA
jgi:class 3 adenylate cyclase